MLNPPGLSGEPKKQGQYGLVIYGLSSIHDAKINNNIGLLKTQQYYLIHYLIL